MADSNHKRADVSEFADNDPFAELTRIMGHDPRAAKPAPSFDDGDFDIDLEKELMGDFAEFDEPAATAPETEQHWRNAAENVEPASDHRFADESDEADQPSDDQVAIDLDEAELDAAFADTYDEEPAGEDVSLAGAEPVPEPAAESPDAWSPYDADAYEPVGYEPVEQQPVVQEAAPPARAPFDDGMAEVDMDFSLLEEDLKLDDEPVAADVAAEAPAQAVAASQAPAGPEAACDDASYDDDVYDPDLAPAAYDEAAAAEDQPVAYAAALDASAAPSLEDELSALLADDEPAVAVSDYAPAAVDEAPAADEWHPAVSTFGQAHTPEEWQEPVDDEAGEAFAADAEPDAGEDATAASGLQDEEIAGIFAEAEDEARAETPTAKAYDPFAALAALGRSMSSGAAAAPAAPASAAAVPAAVAPARSEPAAQEPLRPWRPEPRDELPEPAFRPLDPDDGDVPDIETVEIADSAQAIADDLDIPEIDYDADAPAANAYDDLQAEFGDAFNDFATEPVQQPVAPAQAAAADHGWQADAGQAAATPAAEANPYAVGEGDWQPEELDYETDLDRAIAMASYEDEAPAAPPAPARRGLLVAAVVAGVAVVGGAGVFAMSLFGDSGLDAPAVVQADDDPMKIRPEDPGGTTVPNQDSEAYRRVAGVESEAAPEQQTLITSAEEPVDVAARAEPAPAAPGISVDDEPAQPEVAAAQPKSEDRIEPVAEEPGIGVNDDLIAVAPRKVRTMIVRPDGTMVPREDPTPAPEVQAVQPQGEQIVAAPAASALPGVNSPILTPPATAPVEGAATPAEEAGPTVDTPATVGVVPSQRREPQQVAAAPARPEPSAAQPTVTPVSAPVETPTASGSEWSMQIASQPTAEGAQATYQDLARRYGSVLQGRGVNIVRADIAGKGVYYRVRIPTANRDEAIELCTQYKSAGGSCFVSR